MNSGVTIKSLIGKFNQYSGVIANNYVGDHLSTMGWRVDVVGPNTPYYGIKAVKGKRKLLIQVKTDVTNDWKYPQVTHYQKQGLIYKAKEMNYTPTIINYDMYNKTIQGIYVMNNHDVQFD